MKTVTIDIVTRAKAIGENIVNAQASQSKTMGLTETLQNEANALRAEGIKFGASVKTCTWRKTISDVIEALCKEKTAAKTCMNYVTSFVKAVNKGEPFSLSGSKGEKGKKDDAKKATAKSDVEKMASALLTVWKLSDVADDLLIRIETNMANDMTLIDAIADVLQFCGHDLTE